MMILSSVVLAAMLVPNTAQPTALRVSFEAKRVKVVLVSKGKNTTVLQSTPSKVGVTLPWLARSSEGKVEAPSVARSAGTKLRPGTLLTVGCDGMASDGVKSWQLAPNASLLLPDGTKLTWSASKSGDYCTKVDVMSGEQRVRLARTKTGAVKPGKVKADRWTVDAKTPDGVVYVLGADEGRYRDWATLQVGKQGLDRGKAIVCDAGDGVSVVSKTRAWQLTPAMLDALVGRGGGFDEVRSGPFGGILPGDGPISGILCDQGCVPQGKPESGKLSSVVIDNGSGTKAAPQLLDEVLGGSIKGVRLDHGVASIARTGQPHAK